MSMKPAEQKLLDRLLADDRLTDPRWVAYIMATVKHETNHTFEPVEEAYWLSHAWRRANLRYWPAHGRGFVQITWPTNYEKMSHRLNMPDLARDYDLALDWDVAYEILVVGMLEGLFTGRDLDDFINDDYCDYYRARKIVNGMDKAALIQGYALEYEKKIRALGTRFVNEPPPQKSICTRTTLAYNAPSTINPCVRVLQQALNKWTDRLFGEAREPLIDDGLFGSITKGTVVHFQKHKGLVADGIVGPDTWVALEPYL